MGVDRDFPRLKVSDAGSILAVKECGRPLVRFVILKVDARLGQVFVKQFEEPFVKYDCYYVISKGYWNLDGDNRFSTGSYPSTLWDYVRVHKATRLSKRVFLEWNLNGG